MQQDCWLNINKPAGPSSALAVAIVKKAYKAKKAGHGGTLDPFASGVLPIALNKATKTSNQVVNCSKSYYFRLQFGEFRDTDDCTGNITDISNIRPTTTQIVTALPNFIGTITQQPSQFSAIKINGKRAYKLARQKLDFTMPTRQVDIFAISLLYHCRDYADLVVDCGKGTYIRTLARDLCKSMQTCGYVAILQRLRVGNFSLQNSISLDVIKFKSIY
jgi:tRNA pseudouridine55 synthase